VGIGGGDASHHVKEVWSKLISKRSDLEVV
jgi:hypothetical protein